MQNEMRDRLIELLFELHTQKIPSMGEIADHLIENGVILLPCRVGDTVYFIYETYDEEGLNRCILDCKVEQVGVDGKSSWFQLKLPLGVKLSGYFRNNTLGKNIFLTREEAEEKLKENET